MEDRKCDRKIEPLAEGDQKNGFVKIADEIGFRMTGSDEFHRRLEFEYRSNGAIKMTAFFGSLGRHVFRLVLSSDSDNAEGELEEMVECNRSRIEDSMIRLTARLLGRRRNDDGASECLKDIMRYLLEVY